MPNGGNHARSQGVGGILATGLVEITPKYQAEMSASHLPRRYF